MYDFIIVILLTIKKKNKKNKNKNKNFLRHSIIYSENCYGVAVSDSD